MWKFWKIKQEKKPWPLPETDYDGHELWARAFPKPRPLSQDELRYYNYLQNSLEPMCNYMYQSATRSVMSSLYGYRALIPWMEF